MNSERNSNNKKRKSSEAGVEDCGVAQSLPSTSEVEVNKDGIVKIVSYIYNLHLETHINLYS